MNKGQSLKEIKPENGIPKNFDAALSGRFTDRNSLAASNAIQALIRNPQPRYRNSCKGVDKDERGHNYYYECDACPYSEGCLERKVRAEADEAALKDFFKKDAAELETIDVEEIRDVAKIFCDAWRASDSEFFRELADLIDILKESNESRISVRDRRLLNTAPEYSATYGAHMVLSITRQAGEEIGREELLGAACNQCSYAIDD
ncbi:MAG: hypothetical protein PHQ12_08735 [Chthoniobacteraceae bacterium]|nr:hypothetical protein [Chthoniobacteraceae bacterium]